MRCSPFLGIPTCLALISFFIFNLFISNLIPILRHGQRFSVEELALYSGNDPGLPILLAILGSVFDVTKGKSQYGIGGGYTHFWGRDASRAFVSGNFTGNGLTDYLQDLTSPQVKSVVEWRDFYFWTYINGNSREYLNGVEAKAARGAQLLEKQKNKESTRRGF